MQTGSFILGTFRPETWRDRRLPGGQVPQTCVCPGQPRLGVLTSRRAHRAQRPPLQPKRAPLCMRASLRVSKRLSLRLPRQHRRDRTTLYRPLQRPCASARRARTCPTSWTDSPPACPLATARRLPPVARRCLVSRCPGRRSALAAMLWHGRQRSAAAFRQQLLCLRHRAQCWWARLNA
jgi:hypothetical protein